MRKARVSVHYSAAAKLAITSSSNSSNITRAVTNNASSYKSMGSSQVNTIPAVATGWTVDLHLFPETHLPSPHPKA